MSVHRPPLGHPVWPEPQPARPEAWGMAGWLGLRPSWLGLRPSRLGLRPSWLGLRPGWIAQREEWTDRRMNGKSPHSTGLCPLSGPLPCFPPCKLRKCCFKIKVKHGKGTADLLMPLNMKINWTELTDFDYQFWHIRMKLISMSLLQLDRLVNMPKY